MKPVSLEQINERGILRLCHFTKAKNLVHILESKEGILASDIIPNHIKDVNDEIRLDKKLNHICCSIEYPNIYYLNSIKDNDKLFKDWIILAIDPKVILDRECLFSPVNAATERGRFVEEGRLAFAKLYSSRIETNKRVIIRGERALKSCPTDIQAEVLIKNNIPSKYIKAIIVENELCGRKERFKLQRLGMLDKINIIVAPDLFKRELGNTVRNGIKPNEYIL